MNCRFFRWFVGILLFSVVLFLIFRVCLTQFNWARRSCLLRCSFSFWTSSHISVIQDIRYSGFWHLREAFKPLEGLDFFGVLLDLNEFVLFRYPGFQRIFVRLYVMFSDDFMFKIDMLTCRSVQESLSDFQSGLDTRIVILLFAFMSFFFVERY